MTAATQLLIVCNPNNPTATHIRPQEIAAFCERVPEHVTVILDEAYIEFQTDDDPDSTVDLLADFPNLVVLRTFSKVYGLAGLRVGYAIGSAKFRAAVDAVRQPFSVNALAQAAGAEAILHGDDVARRVEATLVERVRVESGLDELGLATTESQANFSWVDLGDGRRGRGRRRARRARRSPSGPARRSATPATCASPTAPRPRTNASSRRSASCWLTAPTGTTLPCYNLCSEATNEHPSSPSAPRRRARGCPSLLLLAI